MATFDLSLFLANPTLSKLNFCCKNDLFEVANYFSLMVPDRILMKWRWSYVLPVPPESAVPETATGSYKTAGYKQEDLPPDATGLSGEAEGLKHRSLCPAMTHNIAGTSRGAQDTEGDVHIQHASQYKYVFLYLCTS